ncbi:MAG: GGDEF domain-containing protein [Pseudorhizobium sp.]
MGTSNLIVYVPPVLFSLVAVSFFLLWKLKLTPSWQWSAGCAQTALGFVLSTFSIQPSFDAFASGMVFIGASYCYGSGLLSHFDGPALRWPRLGFVAVYTVALFYLVFVEKSLVYQLFLTDMGFAFLLGWAIFLVRKRATRSIDLALLVTSTIVVLDCVLRATFFTFFTGSSNDFADFADSAYNLSVHVTTITVCMFFPFSALGAIGYAALERYRSAAETDELTGLLNRRGFKQALEREFGTSTKWGAIIVCDIDHFKRVNDSYGHAIGDKVIGCLAADIREVIGRLGYTARYGGEEFVAFLPKVAITDATALAHSLRITFASRHWLPWGIGEQFTVSCGVASLTKEDPRIESALERADQALYAAKAGGRNRICIEGGEPQFNGPIQLVTGSAAR